MIPLKMLMVGLAWQLGLIVVVMAAMLMAAYVWLHRISMPVTWPWVLFYAAVIAGASELLYAGSKIVDPSVPIHIEVLLPAFVIGCIARPRGTRGKADAGAVEHALHDILDRRSERRTATVVSATFMVVVGLGMPAIFGGPDIEHPMPTPASLHASAPANSVDDPRLHGGEEQGRYTTTITASQPSLGWSMIVVHVLVITVLSNLGKMFPALCYRREAHWRHRMAVAIGMWPRGEVGAGILVLSLGYGIGGPIVTVAMLSLALNLALTGVFILIVKRLIRGVPEGTSTQAATGEKTQPDLCPLRCEKAKFFLTYSNAYW
jgi:hypothetical protein